MRHTVAALAALICMLAAVHANDASNLIAALEGIHPSAFFAMVSGCMLAFGLRQCDSHHSTQMAAANETQCHTDVHAATTTYLETYGIYSTLAQLHIIIIIIIIATVYDAMGKIPSGILLGNTYSFGSYDECAVCTVITTPAMCDDGIEHASRSRSAA